MERPPPKPRWLKVNFTTGPKYFAVQGAVKGLGLHTVCEEARCPNIFQCWGEGTATFMILGDVCTRRCSFCAVTHGRPSPVDWGEPWRIALAARRLKLRHVVITSVARDDLPDGGAALFARCIEACRALVPGCQVEVLVPDFGGLWEALARVVNSRPHVVGHNVETVPRLYKLVRPGARYQRSLELLSRAKEMDPQIITKSGLMVGLGETWSELLSVMGDLREAGVDIITVGQYLRPTLSGRHLKVERFYTPEEFEALRKEALRLGFRAAECGPLVRSSYLAHRAVAQVMALRGLPGAAS